MNRSTDALHEAAHALAAGGVDQVLVIAGDVDKPAGPYMSSLELTANRTPSFDS